MTHDDARRSRIRLYTAMAAGGLTPIVTADIRLYDGPPIPVNGVTTLSMDGLEFEIGIFRANYMNSGGGNGNPCCVWGSYSCKQYGGSNNYYGDTYQRLTVWRPNGQMAVSGLDVFDLGAEVDSPDDDNVRVDGCQNNWSSWFYCNSGGGFGTRSNCEWEQETFYVGFEAGDATGGGNSVNGWIQVEVDPNNNNALNITRWAFEDDGGPIDAGEGYCEADTANSGFEFIQSVQIEDAGFFNRSGDDGYTDYTTLGAISLDAGESYVLKVLNGDPTWVNDALGVFVDWNGDYEFDGPLEDLGVVEGVGPYFVTIEVPEDHPGGEIRMRLRLQDTLKSPMAPCGVALYGETEDYALAIDPIPPCPGDLNDDGEVTAADLGLLIGAWGPCGDPTDCPGDVNGDGEVTAADLGLLVGAWGPCPR